MSKINLAWSTEIRKVENLLKTADVTRILGDLGISIEAIIQKQPAADADDVPIIMLTHCVREQKMQDAISRIEALPSSSGAITRIRMETLG